MLNLSGSNNVEPKDNRGFPRIDYPLDVYVYIKDEKLKGNIENLTVGGFSIELEREFPPSTELSLEIISDDEKIRNAHLKVEVLRCVPSEKKPKRRKSPKSYCLAVKLSQSNHQYLMDAMKVVKEHKKI